MDIDTLLQNLDLSEDQELEFKAASEELPKSLWASVSAFANTDGGYIVLGVSEGKYGAVISGVKNVDRQIQDFWNQHNNSQKLNVPICTNEDVTRSQIEGKTLIIIQVPRASRTQKPIYINNNPKTGTYKRNHEGDYICSEDELRQMMRDASNDPQDLQILDKFGLDDLDQEALKAYRQRFRSREPDHPWLALDDKGLLQQLGGWHQGRNSEQEGLTIAGLLMFGRELPIRDALPYHHLDYQERLSSDPEQRWTYRLTLDGRWEPNLFNFYFQVYGRLIKDLDLPFELDKNAVRLGETHVHEALREALVNCLIHADHLSTRPLTILKFSDSFTFSNPGRLRILLKSLYAGGFTDPRNPTLQRMFQMLGLGEKAGSGFQKILRAWQEQHWFTPQVSENLDMEITSVNLSLLSNSDHSEADSDHSEADSDHSEADSDHSEADSDHSEADSDHSDQDVEAQKLLEIAEPIRNQRRSDHQQLQNIILQLCSERYLSLRQLAELLLRKPVTLRASYISPMLSLGLLELRYPDQLNHPEQAYTSRSHSTSS